MHNIFSSGRCNGKSIVYAICVRSVIQEEVAKGKNVVVVCHTCRERETKELLGDIAEIICVDCIPKSILYYLDKDEITKLPAVEFKGEL